MPDYRDLSGNAPGVNLGKGGSVVTPVDNSGQVIGGSGAPSVVAGNVAHDAADSGNPVKIGGKASYNPPAAVSAIGDRVDAAFTLNGGQFVCLTEINGNAVGAGGLTTDDEGDFVVGLNARAYNFGFNGTDWTRFRNDVNGLVIQTGLSATFWNYAAAAGGIVSSTADVVLKAAGGAGVRNFIKTLTINHDTLSAVTECVVKDGATIMWRGKLQTAATDVSNGSGTIIFDPPLRGTANTAMNFALLTSVTGGVFVNAQGFQGA